MCLFSLNGQVCSFLTWRAVSHTEKAVPRTQKESYGVSMADIFLRDGLFSKCRSWRTVDQRWFFCLPLGTLCPLLLNLLSETLR